MYGTNYTLFVLVLGLMLTRKTFASLCQIAQTCVTDLSQADCGAGEHLVSNINIFGCCPNCIPIAETPPDDGSCSAPSNCLDDGRYAPVQCKGDRFTGRCFCSDENGNRIFGQMWRDEASEMTCACSRRRHEFEVSGRKRVTLHCDRTGSYEPLQCDDGMCWCAEPATGQPTTIQVREENMHILPCYDAKILGDQYLRRCESVLQALASIYQEQSEHGTNFLGSTSTFCDYDGSYGPYQIQSGAAYCTGRDGEILGAWSAPIETIADMDCSKCYFTSLILTSIVSSKAIPPISSCGFNTQEVYENMNSTDCARDSAIFFPERGMVLTEACQGNGNYQRTQTAGGVTYCVDSDGYEISCDSALRNMRNETVYNI